MSDLAIFILDAAVKSFIIVMGLITGFAYTTLLERRFIAMIQQRIGPNRAGPGGFLQPAADAVKLIFKEDIIPTNADKVVFMLAPMITTIPALIVLAVVPLGKSVTLFGHTTSLGIADINVGVLYILAVTSISVYGIVLAGWASANKFAMMGGLRSSAQMISYELAMGLSILAPVMLVGSLSLGDMIDAQKNMWFIVLQPLAGLIFYITLLAETNRAPFDLPDAEQELTAGYHSEYSGMKFGAFFLAEYVKMIAVSAIFATVFLGGFRFFGLESLPIHIGAIDLTGWLGPIILIAKIVPSLLLMVWIRATLPRIRYDYLMALGWKILLPLSLLNLIVTAVLVVLGVFPTFGA